MKLPTDIPVTDEIEVFLEPLVELPTFQDQ